MSLRVSGSAVLAVVAIAGVLAGVNGLTDRERDASADQSALRKLTTATAKRIFTGAHDLDEINNVQHQLLIGPPGPVR